MQIYKTWTSGFSIFFFLKIFNPGAKNPWADIKEKTHLEKQELSMYC